MLPPNTFFLPTSKPFHFLLVHLNQSPLHLMPAVVDYRLYLVHVLFVVHILFLRQLSGATSGVLRLNVPLFKFRDPPNLIYQIRSLMTLVNGTNLSRIRPTSGGALRLHLVSMCHQIPILFPLRSRLEGKQMRRVERCAYQLIDYESACQSCPPFNTTNNILPLSMQVSFVTK